MTGPWGLRAIISYYVNLCYPSTSLTGLSEKEYRVGAATSRRRLVSKDLAMQGHAIWGTYWPSALWSAPLTSSRMALVSGNGHMFNAFRNTQGRFWNNACGCLEYAIHAPEFGTVKVNDRR